MKPLVSIILPTYNGARYIGRAIKSVQAQTYTSWELIIIDDGSTDTLKEVAESFQKTDNRIMYSKNEVNYGIQKSLNRGIAQARGVYIARIDDDDIWNDVEKLAQQVRFLETHTDHVLVGTGAILVDEKEKQLAKYMLPETDTRIRWKMLRKNCFVHSSVLFRNTGVLYSENEDMRHVEDYELWLRLGLLGKLANLPYESVTLSIRPATLTAQNRVVQARRTIGLVWQFRSHYPGIISGLCVSLLRYVFFIAQSCIPIPTKLFYWIQATQRGM